MKKALIRIRILFVVCIGCLGTGILSGENTGNPKMEIIAGPMFSQDINNELGYHGSTYYLPVHPVTRITFLIKNTGDAVAHDVKYTFYARTCNFDPDVSTNGKIDRWFDNVEYLNGKLNPPNKQSIILGDLKPGEVKDITLELNILNQITEVDSLSYSRNFWGDNASWQIIMRMDYLSADSISDKPDMTIHRLILSDPVTVYFFMG